MPDLIQKRFGYSQLWSLQSVCRQIQTGSYMPDPTSCVCFGSVLSKKAWIILCKNGPDPIWMAWSGFCQTHLVQKQTGVQESSDLVLADCNWPTTSFPRLDMVAFFHRRPWSCGAKPAWIWFVLADCVRFGPNRSVPEASQCARIIWPTSGFWADPDWTQIVSGMFLGEDTIFCVRCKVAVGESEAGLWHHYLRDHHQQTLWFQFRFTQEGFKVNGKFWSVGVCVELLYRVCFFEAFICAVKHFKRSKRGKCFISSATEPTGR